MDILRVRMNTNEPVLPRKRKTPRRFKVGEGDSSHSSTVEDHYRKLYFEALDLAINCIQDRFNQPGYKLYQTLEELIVKAANKEDYSEQLHKVVAFYGSDFDIYLRSTMKQDRLNHLMILNIYKELTKKLDLVKVANEFISGSEHRKNFFGSF